MLFQNQSPLDTLLQTIETYSKNLHQKIPAQRVKSLDSLNTLIRDLQNRDVHYKDKKAQIDKILSAADEQKRLVSPEDVQLVARAQEADLVPHSGDNQNVVLATDAKSALKLLLNLNISHLRQEQISMQEQLNLLRLLQEATQSMQSSEQIDQKAALAELPLQIEHVEAAYKQLSAVLAPNSLLLGALESRLKALREKLSTQLQEDCVQLCTLTPESVTVRVGDILLLLSNSSSQDGHTQALSVVMTIINSVSAHLAENVHRCRFIQEATDQDSNNNNRIFHLKLQSQSQPNSRLNLTEFLHLLRENVALTLQALPALLEEITNGTSDESRNTLLTANLKTLFARRLEIVIKKRLAHDTQLLNSPEKHTLSAQIAQFENEFNALLAPQTLALQLLFEHNSDVQHEKLLALKNCLRTHFQSIDSTHDTADSETLVQVLHSHFDAISTEKNAQAQHKLLHYGLLLTLLQMHVQQQQFPLNVRSNTSNTLALRRFYEEHLPNLRLILAHVISTLSQLIDSVRTILKQEEKQIENESLQQKILQTAVVYFEDLLSLDNDLTLKISQLASNM